MAIAAAIGELRGAGIGIAEEGDGAAHRLNDCVAATDIPVVWEGQLRPRQPKYILTGVWPGAMRLTSKGQVTIPQRLWERFGLLPYTEVRFVEEGGRVIREKLEGQPGRGRKGCSGCSRYGCAHPPEHR